MTLSYKDTQAAQLAAFKVAVSAASTESLSTYHQGVHVKWSHLHAKHTYVNMATASAETVADLALQNVLVTYGNIVRDELKLREELEAPFNVAWLKHATEEMNILTSAR